MSIIAWIVLGLVAGFIASKVINKQGEGLVMDIVLGVVGAVVGGWVFRLVGMSGVTGLNLYSLLVAVLGAVVFLLDGVWRRQRQRKHGRLHSSKHGWLGISQGDRQRHPDSRNEHRVDYDL